ncbi:MAG TPA: hypothetical protein VFD30_12470 [Terriglobia bacterium]|nr:hypothetical protein [Terriglobia bacterium]
MELAAKTEVRDFRIRGNYFSPRSLLWQGDRRSKPGYSPPVVDFDLLYGAAGTITVSESDIPVLSDEKGDAAKHHLSLILEARQGDRQAAEALAAALKTYQPNTGQLQPSESPFVVPCTSCAPHSEQTISQKASILLRLCQDGYPVPEFVVLTANAYNETPPRLDVHLTDALRQLEILTGQELGSAATPLIFAVRCATSHYLPGVMDTYLNVGVTDRTLPALENIYGPAVAQRMFLNNLKNLCRLLNGNKPLGFVSAVKNHLCLEESISTVRQLCEAIAKYDRRLIEDPFAQAEFFVRYAYKHFDENRDLVLTLCRGTEHYPSVILQKMICTVRHENAYAGVISSRNTQTGIGVELQTAHNIFGEEMMTGTAEVQSTAFHDREMIKEEFPAVHHFAPHLKELELQFESPVTIEFAVEATARSQWFALLQLNETGMAGRAAFIAMVDMHKSGIISRKRVAELIRPYHVKQLTSDTIDQEVFDALNPFCSGVSVLPRSAVSARIYFSGEAALRAKSQGEKVCLCKKTFVPTDTVVMREMDAITSLTSAAIHVVTICQSLGIPALLSLEKDGVRLQPGGGLVNSAGREIKEGDWVTLSSRRRTLFEGEAKFVPGRLLRYLRGEPVAMDEEERKSFAAIAYAYRYYQQLTKGLELDQVSSLNEVTRLVNFELRGDSEQAQKLVNGWFDEHETQYMEGVLKSDIGDHLGQSNVFEMLTLERKIRFFKQALAKCSREQVSGYEAGAFMLGRFLCMRYPASFWKRFTPFEIGLLVNEWVLFEKYMQVLHNVGERRVLMARKQILKGGLEELSLHPGNVQPLITLKLSGAPLQEAKESLPAWSDPQAARVLELLQQPYGTFYDFKMAWSVGQLERICGEENLPLPQSGDV